jgi:hypothetical protein
MLTAVTAHRLTMITCLLALTAATTACASTVGGAGTTTDRPTLPASSKADFPTGGATATVGGSTPARSPAGPTSRPPSTASGVHPAPAAPLRTATVTASSGTTYVVKVWADVKDSTCSDHAWGAPMISFLTRHPCQGLERYLGTTTVGGRPVGFAEAVTSFRGTAGDPYAYATKFSDLERADGTGSISDLLREGYRLPSGPTKVPAAEAFNVIGQDNGVTVWDAWYLDGPTPDGDKALITMTTDIFLQF